jgi:hypothetical protein
MNEDALRALVREVIGRHMGHAAAPASCGPAAPPAGSVPLAWRASHSRYPLFSGEDLDGPCLIEPVVRCNHCGYCQSHGH